ncbi:Discoidin domain-containing receptor 2 [Toxocara canis]|uniref:Discoidin domain-containing receptor 2 n=1 Tax=Toxocara canis TaxID=6265 RepID=A0A0B2VAJ2_TOXCA|nr:Discoidin domain-containing receptor 2 [Toxocara canis]
MESGVIEDSQITASSSFDTISVGPQNARIRKELASGAWCPKAQISKDVYEFLQINLDRVFTITAVETQGRYGNGTGREYPTEYMIDYVRDGDRWMRYQSRKLSHLLEGNVDTSTVVYRSLDPPIIASRIRFVPFSLHPRTMCMRVEIYGCKYDDGLMYYSMNHDGSRIGDYDFRDRIFENSQMKSTFSGTKKGLGLLTDGLIATWNPLSDYDTNASNSSWIGWNQLMTNGSIELVFEFDQIRNFSFMEIWAYGSSLRTIEVTFSTDGKNFSLSSQISSIQRSVEGESRPRQFPLRIPMHGRRGSAVKLRLTFTDLWLFLTEVHFHSSATSSMVLSSQNSTTLTSTTSVPYNTTTTSASVRADLLISSIFFSGLLLLFAFITCIVCGVVVKRRRSSATNNYRKRKVKMLVTSAGQKGISTDLYPTPANDFQFHKGALFLDNDKKWQPTTWGGSNLKSPSWSNFHFPPPPSDMYGVDESSAEPLLGRMSTPTPAAAVSPRRNHIDRTWPKKKIIDENLHYATSNVTESAKSYKPTELEKIDSRSVLIGSELGEGRFTVVRVAKIRDKTVAVKMLRETVPQAKSALIDEAKILSQIDHPNVLKLYGTSEDLSLYLELASNGNIRRYVRQRPNIAYANLVKMATEIASGMKYLEQKRIVHGHLSPQCILVDANLHVKIASPRGLFHHAQLRYSAPECIIANEWTSKSDVWSFAVSAWEILSRCEHLPFEQMSNNELLENSRRLYYGGEVTYLKFDSSVAVELSDLMRDCWRTTSSERPTFLEIQYFLSAHISGPRSLRTGVTQPNAN